jgi:hypothetical protein
MIYSLYTLVDITETKQRHGGEVLARNQQQNFDVVLQTIGLCGNVYYKKSPELVPADVFGDITRSAWYFEWSMELEDIFTIDDSPIAKLKEIFQYVPVITGLTESVEIPVPMFIIGKNIVFDFK